MVTGSSRLAALERIARMKAERELKQFGAFNAHMAAARQHAEAMQAALEQCYRSVAPLNVAEARMANAQAGRAARDLRRADQEISRMKPRFDAARQQAIREFGRARVLLELARREATKTTGRDS